MHESRANLERFSSDIQRRVLKSVKSSSISPYIGGLATAKDGCNGIVETHCNYTHALGKSGRCSASARVVDFGCRICNLCYRQMLMYRLLFVYEIAKILVPWFIDVKSRNSERVCDNINTRRDIWTNYRPNYKTSRLFLCYLEIQTQQKLYSFYCIWI